jgi:hypothetical protein
MAITPHPLKLVGVVGLVNRARKVLNIKSHGLRQRKYRADYGSRFVLDIFDRFESLFAGGVLVVEVWQPFLLMDNNKVLHRRLSVADDRLPCFPLGLSQFCLTASAVVSKKMAGKALFYWG